MFNVTYTLTGQPVISGGSRQPVTARMINRPWQPPFPARGTKCPFCPPEIPGGILDQLTTKGEVVEWHSLGERQMVSLKTAFTPHLAHELLTGLTETPWVSNPAELSWILKIISQVQDQRIISTPCTTNVQLGYHSGQCGGQNISHPHWHIIGSDYPQPSSCPWCNSTLDSVPTIWETENLRIVLDGVRAGQTVIAAKNHDWAWKNNCDEIAQALWRLVGMFRNKFNDPEFILTNAIQPEGHFWLEYTPILSHWGCTEMLALRGLGAFTHPCSPGAMLEFLTG